MLCGPTFMHTIDQLERRVLLAFAFGYGANFGDVETLDSGNTVAVDAAGNTYFAGTFRGKVDVDPRKQHARFLNAEDNYDAFLVKYDPNGKLIWSQQIGSSDGDETIEHLVIGPSGDVYATGQFEEVVDFDASGAVHRLTSHGQKDGFIRHVKAGG